MQGKWIIIGNGEFYFMNGKITVSNGQAVKKLKIHLPYKYYNNTLKTSISDGDSIINLNCTSKVKLGHANSYDEGIIKLDISKYDAILSNNSKIKFSTYNISGNKLDGSIISTNSVSGNMTLNINEYVYDMVSGIDKAVKQISDNVSSDGIEINMKDIGFIN